MAKYCLTQKKRENFQLAAQNEALGEKVATLQVECSIMKDENRVYKDELAAVKAELDMEIEQLQRENQAYKEELAAFYASLEQEGNDKLESSMKQSSISGDQAGDTDEATKPAEEAEAGKDGR